MSIPVYVRGNAGGNGVASANGDAAVTLEAAIREWKQGSEILRKSMEGIFQLFDSVHVSPTPDPENKRRNRQVPAAFKRAVLAAEITAQLYRDPTFGSVKQEKVIYLCERRLGLETELNRHYRRQAAGPYDPSSKRSIESNFKKQKWFDVRRTPGQAVKYVPMANFGTHYQYFERYFGDRKQYFQKIIDLLRPLNTERCEIVLNP